MTARALVRDGVSLAEAQRRLRLAMLQAAMVEERGNCGRAARRLGIHRNTAFRMLQRAGTSVFVLRGIRAGRHA